MSAPDFSCDDRGNVVDFYWPSGDKAATLDREAEVDGIEETAWDGGPEVTAWAIANGYAEEIEGATKI